MDSDTPDLKGFQELCHEYNAILMVDVAHDLGCSGPGGSGEIGRQDMLGKIDLVMGSFSKTFASNGGFVSSNNEGVKQYLRYYSAPNTFSNALSPPAVAVVEKALEIIRSDEGEQLRNKLFTAINVFRTALTENNLSVLGVPSPIVPVLVGKSEIGRVASKFLADEGVLSNLVEFPAVALYASRFRMQVMSEHTVQQCQEAAIIIGRAIKMAQQAVDVNSV